MFRNHHYWLIFELLTNILKLMKHEMTKKIYHEKIGFGTVDIWPEYEDLIENITSMINLPNVTQDVQKLLDLCLSQEPKDFGPNKWMKLSVPWDLGSINYRIPKNEPHLDIMWHGPFFLNMITFEDFYYILRAILLEKSIVFISQNLNFLSSIINGFRVLIKPFKWCHLFIAILPKLLIDYMMAPQPMLLGIQDKQEFLMEVDQEAIDDKIWVEMDSLESKMVVHRTFDIPELKLGTLKNQLKKLFKKLKNDNQAELRASTYWISTTELENSKQIAETIESTLDCRILSWVRNFKAKFPTQQGRWDYDECKASVLKNADQRDKKFIEMFVQTQMFAYYFDLFWS